MLLTTGAIRAKEEHHERERVQGDPVGRNQLRELGEGGCGRHRGASGTVRDLRVAEVADLDVVVENGAVSAYRAKLNVSFKYEDAE